MWIVCVCVNFLLFFSEIVLIKASYTIVFILPLLRSMTIFHDYLPPLPDYCYYADRQ